MGIFIVSIPNQLKFIIYKQGGRNEICLGEAPKIFQGEHTETKHKIEKF